MKNILDKLDLGMKFFIIAVFGIAVIYCILSSVFGLFKSEKKEEKIDINNIDKYVTIYSDETGDTDIDTSKLVKNYSTYYTVESAVKNFIEALVDEGYSKTYGILSEEMKEKYSKKEYLNNIEKFVSENFKDNETTYDVDYCLNKVYYISDDNKYLCECKNINEDIVKIGINLNITDNTYTVFYVEF